MSDKGLKHKVGLEHHGIKNAKEIFWNLTTPALYEHISRNGEGQLSHLGPVVVATGQHTGRAPNDKFVVKEPTSQDDIWWGKVNKPFGVEQFDALHGRILAYLQNKSLYVQDCCAGADQEKQLHIRVVTETAWHNLFARNKWTAL